jgi:hypothetical protein
LINLSFAQNDTAPTHIYPSLSFLGTKTFLVSFSFPFADIQQGEYFILKKKKTTTNHYY